MKRFLRKSKPRNTMRRRPLRRHKRVEQQRASNDESDDEGSDQDYCNESEDEGHPQAMEELYQVALTENRELKDFLKSPISNKTSSAARTLITRIGSLLAWLNKKIEALDGEKLPSPFEYLIRELVRTQYRLLSQYYEYLAEVLKYKASTIMNHNNDLQYFLNWFIVFRYDSVYSITPPELHSINVVIRSTRKLYAKQRKSEVAAKPNSIEELIAMREWPPNGISDLYEAVCQEISWLESVLLNGSVNKTTYELFMELLYAALYSTSAQGRQLALELIQVKALGEMLRSDATFGDKFKTSGKYGLQPIILSETSKYLLRIYMHHFRPVVSNVCNPEDTLFLSFEGKPIKCGLYVTRFFKRTLNMHITTTRIRCIVETSSEQLHSAGSITISDRDAISNISGHTHETAKKYYIKKARLADVGHSSNVFTKLLPTQLEDATQLGKNLSYSDNNIILADYEDSKTQVVPGSEHPNFGSILKRVPWTKFEISYVGKWCSANKLTNNVVAQCLKSIRSDPNIVTKFHPIHIVDSARLRHAWEVFKENNEV